MEDEEEEEEEGDSSEEEDDNELDELSVDEEEVEEAIETGGILGLIDAAQPLKPVSGGRGVDVRSRLVASRPANTLLYDETAAKSHLTLSEFSALLESLGFVTDPFRLFAILDHIEHFREVPTNSQVLLELDIRGSLGIRDRPCYVRRERKIDLNFIEYFLVQKEIDPDTFQISRACLDWVVRRYRRVDPIILTLEKADKRHVRQKLARERAFLGKITRRRVKKKGEEDEEDEDAGGSDGGDQKEGSTEGAAEEETSEADTSARAGSGSREGGGSGGAKNDKAKNDQHSSSDGADADANAEVYLKPLPEPDSGLYFQEQMKQLDVPPPALAMTSHEEHEIKRHFAAWVNDADPPEWGALLTAFKREGDNPWRHDRFKALLLRRGFRGEIAKTINMLVTLGGQSWRSEIGPEDIQRAQRMLGPYKTLKLSDRYPMFGTGLKSQRGGVVDGETAGPMQFFNEGSSFGGGPPRRGRTPFGRGGADNPLIRGGLLKKKDLARQAKAGNVDARLELSYQNSQKPNESSSRPGFFQSAYNPKKRPAQKKAAVNPVLWDSTVSVHVEPKRPKASFALEAGLPPEVNYRNKIHLKKYTNLHIDNRAAFRMDRQTAEAHERIFQVSLDPYPTYEGILGPTDFKHATYFRYERPLNTPKYLTEGSRPGVDRPIVRARQSGVRAVLQARAARDRFDATDFYRKILEE